MSQMVLYLVPSIRRFIHFWIESNRIRLHHCLIQKQWRLDPYILYSRFLFLVLSYPSHSDISNLENKYYTVNVNIKANIVGCRCCHIISGSGLFLLRRWRWTKKKRKSTSKDTIFLIKFFNLPILLTLHIVFFRILNPNLARIGRIIQSST